MRSVVKKAKRGEGAMIEVIESAAEIEAQHQKYLALLLEATKAEAKAKAETPPPSPPTPAAPQSAKPFVAGMTGPAETNSNSANIAT